MMTTVMALGIGNMGMVEIIKEKMDRMGSGEITMREIVPMTETKGSKIEMPAGREFLATELLLVQMDRVQAIPANPGLGLIMDQNHARYANNHRSMRLFNSLGKIMEVTINQEYSQGLMVVTGLVTKE